MEIRVDCPSCGKKLKIPINIKNRKGRCPKCSIIFELQPYGNDFKAKIIPKSKHILIKLTASHSDILTQYGNDIQKIYKLIRERHIHKKEYDEQKKILRNQAFTPIIEDILKLKALKFVREDRINLWKEVYKYLPHTLDKINPDVVLNLYPRYEYACVISLGYLFAGLSDYDMKRDIINFSLVGDRNSKKIKGMFQNILSHTSGIELNTKISDFLKEIRQVDPANYVGDPKDIEQMTEDFNYGASWIGFHI